MGPIRGRTLASVVCVTALVGACSSNAGAGRTPSTTVAPAVATAPPATGSTAGSPSAAPLPTQSPVPAESNPPGDIPDTTAYVPYLSAAGRFRLKIPEGWARATKPSSVGFSSALNSVTLAWKSSAAAPTVASAKSSEVSALKASTLAFTLRSVKSVTLPGGPAVLITYEANSAANAVTGKQYRLVIERFEFFNKGVQADMSLSSAVGSDNVDPWRIVSESFRWV
jgi:hypothetical protein